MLLTAGAARAEPQASVGLTVGVAGEGLDHQIWRDRTAFHLGLHGDVLFGRSSNSDFGFGPYAEILSHDFDEVQFGGGVSGLLPILDTFPLVLSVGAYGRKGSDAFGLEPGVAGELFWGSRSYNFNSRYVLSGGLLDGDALRAGAVARDVGRRRRAGRPRAPGAAGPLPGHGSARGLARGGPPPLSLLRGPRRRSASGRSRRLLNKL